MGNQHHKISGYRELDQAEIDLMNEVAQMAEEVGSLVERIQRTTIVRDAVNTNEPMFDQRWVDIGKTDLQTGFKALLRSIAKPGTF